MAVNHSPELAIGCGSISSVPNWIWRLDLEIQIYEHLSSHNLVRIKTRMLQQAWHSCFSHNDVPLCPDVTEDTE